MIVFAETDHPRRWTVEHSDGRVDTSADRPDGWDGLVAAADRYQAIQAVGEVAVRDTEASVLAALRTGKEIQIAGEVVRTGTRREAIR